MGLDIYINYRGNCEKAFRFYEQYLEAKVISMISYLEPPPNFPKKWNKPILRAKIEIGGTRVWGADTPHTEPMRSAYLTLLIDTSERAEYIYNLLSSDGEVHRPLEKTDFAECFSLLRDRFGTLWMLLVEN